MADALVFRLNAALGSMGGVAVGERRSGWDRPGRSAVLGLLGACLGLERSDDDGHRALGESLGLAVREDHTVGATLIDFHTAQVPPAKLGKRYATRAEELAAPQLETILTRRDYRTDLAFTIVAWQRGDACRWSLHDLANAMHRPVFAPYFGRKSCPLTLPMRPEIVADVSTVADALARYDASAHAAEAAQGVPRSRRAASSAGRSIWADVAAGSDLPLGVSTHRVEVRRDDIVNRRRWQFGLRQEVVGTWTASPSQEQP